MVSGERVYSFKELRGLDRPKKLAFNTVARFEGGMVCIRLHYTDVIKIDSQNNYHLYSGGWHTVTTLDRLNGFSPAKVCIHKGCLYLIKNLSDGRKKGNLIEFFEGITVNQWGEYLEEVCPL